MSLYAGGGIVGQSKDCEYTCCYAISDFEEKFIGYGNTEGQSIYTGGLIGNCVSKNTFENCYFTGGSNFAVGTPEENPQSTKSLSYDDLKKQTSYEGFDFENVWSMQENGYAVLDFEKINKNNDNNDIITVELTEAEIIKVPFTKRIVFGNSPKSPEGIVVELRYSDGTTYTEEITSKEDGYFINGEKIAEYKAVKKYGIKNADLYLNDGKIRLSYKYLALPSIIDLFTKSTFLLLYIFVAISF